MREIRQLNPLLIASFVVSLLAPSLALQIQVQRVQYLAALAVLFQQMA
jgi:hypothetical protein